MVYGGKYGSVGINKRILVVGLLWSEIKGLLSYNIGRWSASWFFQQIREVDLEWQLYFLCFTLTKRMKPLVFMNDPRDEMMVHDLWWTSMVVPLYLESVLWTDCQNCCLWFAWYYWYWRWLWLLILMSPPEIQNLFEFPCSLPGRTSFVVLYIPRVRDAKYLIETVWVFFVCNVSWWWLEL